MTHTLEINIADSLYETFIAFIKNLPQDIISVKKIETKNQLSSQFLADKKMFNQRFEDIQNGNAILLSQDDYQNKMNGFIQELEAKYADNYNFGNYKI